MYHRKSIIISCLLGAMSVLAAVVFLLYLSRDKEPVSESAVCYDQLMLNVSFTDTECRVRIWEDEEGCYYFFLPSGIEDKRIVFGNLGSDSILRLGDNLLTGDDSISDIVEYGRAYEMQMTVSDDVSPLGAVQVVFMKSDGIPSLYIDTESGSLEAIHDDKENKERAFLLLVDAEGNREYADNLEYIKGRGNSSFDRAKKSYQIKLSNEYAFLGMAEAKRWILQANAIDDSLIKNSVIFDFAEKYTTVPSIHGEYADLYINGDYLGNYYICEKIEVGENRVNITNLEEKTEEVNFEGSYQNAELYVSEDGMIKATAGLQNPDDITGGYLVEYIGGGAYETVDNAFMTDSGLCYEILSPDPATIEQAEYIRSLFNETEIAIAQPDGINPETGKHFSEYLDVDSWTSKYVMEEVFHDRDANRASMYYYKDSDEVDTHIFSGPMWDYDRTFGSYGYGYQTLFLDGAQKIDYCGLHVTQLMQFPEIQEQVRDKFRQYFLPYAEYLVRADIYTRSQAIRASLEMDRRRWPQVFGHYADIDAARDYMMSYLEQRVDYLQDVWLEDEEYCTVRFTDYDGNIFAEYTVKKGECLESLPEVVSPVAFFINWYDVTSGTAFDKRLPIYNDMTICSEWLDVDILLTNGLNMAEMDISQMDPEILRNLADIIEAQQRESGLDEGNDVQQP